MILRQRCARAQSPLLHFLPLLHLVNLWVDRRKERRHSLLAPMRSCSGLSIPEAFSSMELPASAQAVLCPNFVLRSICVLIPTLPKFPGLWPSPALRVVEYLQSLAMHSESSRQEAPMGLRETPLQNGVILRSLLFAELGASIGEPSTCRAETASPQVWLSWHPAALLGRMIPSRTLQTRSSGPIPQDRVRLSSSASVFPSPPSPHVHPVILSLPGPTAASRS